MRWNLLEGLEALDAASLLSQETHRHALTTLAAAALQKGQHKAAFLLADRCCRIDLPQPEHLLLRAEASKGLGHQSQAIRDIEAALAIDPEHLLALRRALTWGNKELRADAAIRLLALEDDIDMLLTAIRAASEDEVAGVAVFKAGNRQIEGWLAWRGKAPVSLRASWADAEVSSHQIDPDPGHPLRHALGSAASLKLERQPESRWVEFWAMRRRIRILGSPLHFPEGVTRKAPSRGSNVRRPGLSIVIPVYEDAAATSACLESVLNDTRDKGQREIIVVDDDSPNPRIKTLLARLSKKSAIRLISHSTNLGFVESVNHALAQRRLEDVILLNADTIVPPGALLRLIEAARTSNDIATVTPFSNNGEFTSFPSAFVQNAMSAWRRIWEIDAVAEKVNAQETVDIPNGIGFCMAIRGDIFDRFGGLESAIESGYLEDVDFCLKAKSAGYRNVCATNVFVGHRGSRSFKERKRSLVMRNMPLIEQRYPSYRASCAAFMKIDPLAPARARIERSLLADSNESFELIGHARQPIDHPVHARLRELAQRANALAAEVDSTGGTTTMRLYRANGGIPQSLFFNSPKQIDEAIGFLRAIRIKRVEIADPSTIPTVVVDALRSLKAGHDVWISTAAPDGLPALSRTLHSARKVMVSSPELAPFLKTLGLPPAQRPKVVRRSPVGRKAKPRSAAGTPLIGVIPLDTSTRTLRFIVELARGLTLCANGLEMIVLGATYDDLQVLAIGNAFVSGPIQGKEVKSMLAAVQPSHLFTINREPIFGYEMQSQAAASKQALACFDWETSKPAVSARGDLLLPPNFDGMQSAPFLAEWCRKGSIDRVSSPRHVSGQTPGRIPARQLDRAFGQKH